MRRLDSINKIAIQFAKIFFAAMLAAIFISCASVPVESEENSEWQFLQPERFETLPSGKTKITFKTDKPKAALYVNNQFHGLTPLEANNLIPGNYFVTIKKEGYKTMQIAIQIKDGVSDFYYIEMELDDGENADVAAQ